MPWVKAATDRITIKLRLQSQPWHMHSGVVTAHREEFEFEHHAGGPGIKATPNDIIARIERYSGLKLAAAFAMPDLDREIRWHCKLARQNGIHVSPIF